MEEGSSILGEEKQHQGLIHIHVHVSSFLYYEQHKFVCSCVRSRTQKVPLNPSTQLELIKSAPKESWRPLVNDVFAIWWYQWSLCTVMFGQPSMSLARPLICWYRSMAELGLSTQAKRSTGWAWSRIMLQCHVLRLILRFPCMMSSTTLIFWYYSGMAWLSNYLRPNGSYFIGCQSRYLLGNLTAKWVPQQSLFGTSCSQKARALRMPAQVLKRWSCMDCRWTLFTQVNSLTGKLASK